VINLNSWYIEMHLDRLNEELLSITYGKKDKEKSQEKKQQTKHNNEMIKISDNHGFW